MKKLLLILILALLPYAASHAKEYNQYAFTPQQGVELISYVTPDSDNYVYNNLRDLTLMGIFRQERDFSLANYVTLPDALKLLFRCAGLEDYAYACGEDLALRAQLGINPDLPCNPTDGFFIAAHLKGLITHQRLLGYFNNDPGCGPGHYAVRGEIIVWLTKLFEIPPSYDFSLLNRYGNTALISPGFKPYFAGAINSGAGIVINGSYMPCSLIKNGEFVTLLTRFYPHILKTNGISSVTATVESVTRDEGTNELVIKTDSDITLRATPQNSCLLLGSSYADNLFMLESVPEAVGRRITCHIKDDTILFVSTTLNRPAAEKETTLTAKLYFYDNLTGAVVFTTGDGYIQFFPDKNMKILVDGNSVSAEELMELTDRTFDIQLVSVNELSFKKIINLTTGDDTK